MMTHPFQKGLFLLPLVVLAVGCQDRPPEITPSLDVSTSRDSETQQQGQANGDAEKVAASDNRITVAAKAKDALFAQLSGRLMEVMKSDGPVAAIDVCSEQAVTIAESVGKEHGVVIGRTSFKLRNPINAPRDWVKPFVEERADAPQYVQLDDGSLGALFPIHLKVKCLMCHGQPDDILDDVKPKLAERYPDDAATGFKLDDLRGWFWVEVPARDSQTN